MVVLCNASKFGCRALSLVAPLDQIDMLVTRPGARGRAGSGAAPGRREHDSGRPDWRQSRLARILTTWNRRPVMFEFFDRRRNVVIAMAHIGALPGSPLYDSKAAWRN